MCSSDLNPIGIDVKKPSKDTVPFHPYIVIKDLFALLIFLIIFETFFVKMIKSEHFLFKKRNSFYKKMNLTRMLVIRKLSSLKDFSCNLFLKS